MNTFLNIITTLTSKTRASKIEWCISDDYYKKIVKHSRATKVTLIYETTISSGNTCILTIGQKGEWNEAFEQEFSLDFYELFFFLHDDLLTYVSSDDLGNNLSLRELADVVRFSMVKNIFID